MRFIFGLILSLFCFETYSENIQESKEIATLFSDANTAGTFVLYDVTENKLTVHDQLRANKRFIPASTFKIPNSLIGLAVGAITDVDQVLPYGGKPQPFKSWEKDMGLRDAIKVSNVPVYKELARRIGQKRMNEYVTKIKFGNMDIGNKVDNFWLVGPLEISALEQTIFLAQLAQGKLPLSSEVQEKVREIVLLEQRDGWALYGKTGWANTQTLNIGWWVGWVVKGENFYSFALNIDINTDADLAKRIPLAKASLKLLQIL